MAKIFICIFSLILFSKISAESISKKELYSLKKLCLQSYNEKNYSKAIPELEKYLQFREEVQFKIYLAKSLLFRTDLAQPLETDEIFERNEKILIIKNNYSKSAKIFSEVILILENTAQKKDQIADLYFLAGLAEYFSENREKSIRLFQKSILLKPELKNTANYNIGNIFEELGQSKDSQIYFKKL